MVEAGEFLALHSGLRLLEHFRVECLPIFEQMPQDAHQVDALAVARPALRACSLRSHSFRGSSAPVCALDVRATTTRSSARSWGWNRDAATSQLNRMRRW